MKKTTALWLWALSGIGAVAVCLSFGQESQGAESTTYGRRNPTDVILPDWQGNWDCNLDGRQTELDLQLLADTLCQGNICQNVFKIAGRMSYQGGSNMPVEQREIGQGDLPSSRQDHLLPLRFNSNEGWLQMLLMMHTGNRESASGYVNWNGIPFGIQCRKAGAVSLKISLAGNTKAETAN
ncbi:MAG: hypothetical protein KME08_11820 [Aphanothece sp. CMT-3BRIN-NPC111]|jgi:hypothetical protein|nr:hypothetical protein [Aphanothece sp. CMT-3BRIN-NPC111]